VSGHEVFTPTLTDVNEGCHLLSAQVKEMHIADVINLIGGAHQSGVVRPDAQLAISSLNAALRRA